MSEVLSALSLPLTDPTWIFFVVLCIILFAPMLLERLHIPQIIGMVLAGVLVGPYGLDILERDMSFKLFGEVGLYYIMFTAGLGMDRSGFKRNLSKSMLFGVLTFSIPFFMGFVLAYYGLKYSAFAALLLGCILSSHTLVSYPIVSRYGLSKHISVTLSVGATMFALMASLFVLAGISGYYNSGGGSIFWLWLILKCVVFCIGITWVYPFLIRWFFRKFADNVMQYIFVLALMFLAAGMSNYCGLQGIFGAFLAGIVFNRYIPSVSPLMNRISFVGNALFIPYFLIGVGMLINVRLLYEQPEELLVVICIVCVATLTKGVAAWIGKILFKQKSEGGWMMFGLTEAHAAGALAMVMVGTQLETAPGEYLISDEVLNAVVMLILFTCIVSSFATSWAARRIVSSKESEEEKAADDNVTLISFSNPDTTEPLVQMALLMRNTHSNKPLIGVNVVLDGEDSMRRREAGIKMLEEASHIAAAADVRMKSGVRVATNVASALIHSVKEYEVSTLMLGLHRRHHLLDKFYGSMTDTLIKGMNRQIAIVKCVMPPNTIRHIHVAIPENAEKERGFRHWVGCLARLAAQVECRINFHGTMATLQKIEDIVNTKYTDIHADYDELASWDDLLLLTGSLNYDHLLVIITARQGSLSYQNTFEQLPMLIEKYFSNNSLMIIYPEQVGSDNYLRTSFHTGLSGEDAYADLHLHSWMEERNL